MEGGGAGAPEGGGGKASKRPREEEEGEEGDGSRCVRPIPGRYRGPKQTAGSGLLLGPSRFILGRGTAAVVSASRCFSRALVCCCSAPVVKALDELSPAVVVAIRAAVQDSTDAVYWVDERQFYAKVLRLLRSRGVEGVTTSRACSAA
eukprot:COSAG01_NODE_1268_length_10965_cov_17.529266_10_plen_148_part_00